MLNDVWRCRAMGKLLVTRSPKLMSAVGRTKHDNRALLQTRFRRQPSERVAATIVKQYRLARQAELKGTSCVYTA